MTRAAMVLPQSLSPREQDLQQEGKNEKSRGQSEYSSQVSPELRFEIPGQA